MIYLAAPLFSMAEREFNRHIVNLLEGTCPVFLPQRDGCLVPTLLGEGLSLDEAFMKVTDVDLSAIRKASLLVAVLDGQNIDEGVAFELGYAAALGKPCVGFQSDFRRRVFGRNNPILESGLVCIAEDEQSLIAAVIERLGMP